MTAQGAPLSTAIQASDISHNQWPARDELIAAYRGMQTVRQVEQKLAALFAASEIPGFIHLSIGQEATAVGVAAALTDRDTLASTHRGHGHAIAKGIDLPGFFLEILGKEEGHCRGRGGSMHIADMSIGMLGANGIVGAGIPLAVGSGLAHQVRKTGSVAVVFFGDGALAEGVVHEALNLAALWKLPLLFVCENNGWSEFSPTSKQFVADIEELARAFGVSGRTVDGNDVIEVGRAAREFADEIRAGGGPRLLQCKTRRVRGHFEGDAQKYRQGVDVAGEAEDDPIERAEQVLIAGGTSPAELEDIRRSVSLAVDNAVEIARAGTAPSLTGALKDVYTIARKEA